ncbi:MULTISPECIES: hypothetical protein [Bradyrhizobium]|uniref:Uncharacterized protein n=1 Tax=Bradyrhizobium frederickii TaxID=2560054 RepID=A0A4Y9LB85_9BRAD|nr:MULTISPECIES: hypothetical protein [Bradyrhizobium]RTE94525.1 hypothetical protein D6B98_01580 [Bradyrhizobium sp. LVM 105]TFV40798.1 hypothetical protein E4K66_08110 [Bradyrhizobium frederickii]
MLPGFRFLFAAILLSTSILVFGLGAAALLRASHEQYVSNPSWRNGPQEQMFAQASEPAQPVLAVLRAEPEVTAEPEPSIRDQVPTIGLPATDPEQVAALTEADVLTQAAAPPAEAAAVEPAKSETTADATAPAPADTLTPADATASIPDAKPDVTPAAVATASEPAPVDPSAALASSAPDVASSKLAALNDPATTAVKDAPAKAKVDSKPESKADDKATKRKAKAKKPHRVVRRPPPQQLQQQLDPFGQQQPAFATTTARTR